MTQKLNLKVSEHKTIKNFTAADIEKYWNKKLSPAEMHDLEKAAMDDPFLADALEGYQHSINPAEELRVLKESFNRKYDDAAVVIPMNRKKYGWLKVAAAIIVLVGAGLLIQQLVFKNNNGGSPIVTVEKTNDDKKTETVTNESPATPTNESVSNQASTQTIINKTQQTEAAKGKINNSFALTVIDSNKTDNGKVADDKIQGDVALQNKEESVTKANERKETTDVKFKEANAITAVPKSADKENENAGLKARAFSEEYKNLNLGNSFNYRVVDAQNNPVPFANVTNTRDNVGTYTDIRGVFNLVSSDSILDVQVRSLGYNSENYRLVPSRQANNLILKEDAVTRNQMDLYQGRSRVLSNASRKDSAEVEEPEVGWGNYNTYVENNIKIPDNVRAKNTLNEVELSFDVDKAGQPINIKVTKSSQCKECDNEAIRLLKEGPKWKKRGKKAKTTISISVDK